MLLQCPDFTFFNLSGIVNAKHKSLIMMKTISDLIGLKMAECIEKFELTIRYHVEMASGSSGAFISRDTLIGCHIHFYY